MRRIPIAVLASTVAAVLVLGGCGGKTRTVTRQAPAQTVTVTTPGTTPTPTATTPATTAPGGFRKPAAGEEELAIDAALVRGEVRKTGRQPSDLAQYTYLELQPNDGGVPLRVAAAGDLELPSATRSKLVDPACRGKLRGSFRVAPAAARASGYEWELVSVTLTTRSCGGP